MSTRILLCLVFLALAGVFNTLLRALRYSAEAGLTRLPERFPASSRRIQHWAPRWNSLLAVVTLLGGLCQIGAVWFAALLHHLDLHQARPGLGAGWIVAFALLFVALTRMLPVIVSHHYADRLTVLSLPVCALLTLLLWPLARVIDWFERHLHLRLESATDDSHRPSAGDEILTLVDQSEDHELDDEEKEIIRSVLEFGDTITREIMTPRVNMLGIEDNLTVADAVSTIKDSPYSRFPVYHEDYDEIHGIVHVKDLLRAMANDQEARAVTELMIEPVFVPESMPINDLLQQMKATKMQTAIAVDEYGGTAGIVTLEDVLEELVGEIEDEHDQASERLSPQPDGSYLLDAAMPTDELNESLQIHVPTAEEYDSVGGYLLFTLGRIPRAGETVTGPDFSLTVKTGTNRRLETLLLRVLPAADRSEP